MKVRILVVDDDRDHAESIADILLAENYEVEVAFSAEEALRRFRSNDFHITVMDVRLPGMNGVQAFFEFRKIRPDAKVILMSGFSIEKLISEALNGGALGILHKPFAAEELLDTLNVIRPRGMVLIADNDPNCAAHTEALLRSNGYRAEIATNGEQAKEKLLGSSCDCLILDLQLPMLSALQIYLELDGSPPRVPTILLVSGLTQQETATRTVVASEVLVKPFEPAVLLETVALLLEARHAAAA